MRGWSQIAIVRAPLVLFALAAALAACGGSSGGTPTTPATSAAPGASTVAAATPPAATTPPAEPPATDQAAPATTPPATGQAAPATTPPPASSEETAPTPGDDAPTLDGSKLPPGVPGDLPDGAYRVEITEADIAAVPMPDELRDVVVSENVGTYTWHLSAGRFRGDQQADPPPEIPEIQGTYVVKGDTVAFYFPSGITFDLSTVDSDGLPPAPVERFRWSAAADGSLRFVPLDGVDPLAAAVIAAHPWRARAGASV